MVFAGYLVGLGLSLALVGLPKAGSHQNALSRGIRLGAVVIASILAQLIVFASGQDWSAIALTYTGSDIADLLGWWQTAKVWIDLHARSITLLDAGLVGIFLLASVSIGSTIAEKLYTQWQAAVHRDQE